MVSMLQVELLDEAETQALGRRLSSTALAGLVIGLQGDLGAGKTALARAMIQSLGYTGTVKSPTYTLVEPYQIGDITVLHLDLYRMIDPQELAYLGVRDEAGTQTVWLVEWPERGGAELPPLDVVITLKVQGSGRVAEMEARSKAGIELLSNIR